MYLIHVELIKNFVHFKFLLLSVYLFLKMTHSFILKMFVYIFGKNIEIQAPPWIFFFVLMYSNKNRNTDVKTIKYLSVINKCTEKCLFLPEYGTYMHILYMSRKYFMTNNNIDLAYSSMSRFVCMQLYIWPHFFFLNEFFEKHSVFFFTLTNHLKETLYCFTPIKGHFLHKKCHTKNKQTTKKYKWYI